MHRERQPPSPWWRISAVCHGRASRAEASAAALSHARLQVFGVNSPKFLRVLFSEFGHVMLLILSPLFMELFLKEPV